MRLVFCCDPTDPRVAEPALGREIAASRDLGIEFDLVDHDALIAGRLDAVTARLTTLRVVELVVFRGWMMKPHHYATLHTLLLQRGRRLINSPEQDRHCHHLPESYEIIREHTPRTVWLRGTAAPTTDDLLRLLAPFGDRAIMVKDFVKSQKHAWGEACFIPKASDREAVERVVRRFLDLQGADLNEGLVFREFAELERVGVHPRSGMPLSREFRQFILDGKPVLSFKDWDEADDRAEFTPPAWLGSVASRVQSRFFTMDVAQRTSGEWLVVELGDGQVSGLPDAADPAALFRALRQGSAASPAATP